jgi:hypothetical protein
VSEIKPVSYNNTKVSATPLAKCSSNCSVTATQPEYWYWTPYTFSTTIVAATVVEIIDTVVQTTRTTTIFNKLPSDYTRPETNAAGTQVQTITFKRSGQVQTTVL